MALDAIRVRKASETDLPEVAEIQAACPQAAHWDVRGYLEHAFLVAEGPAGVLGFIVLRTMAGQESEILNLAVGPGSRRQGVGISLLQEAVRHLPGPVFLEVRASNRAALDFYQCFGFQVVGRRPGYYENPSESAVVMKFHSCYCHK